MTFDLFLFYFSIVLLFNSMAKEGASAVVFFVIHESAFLYCKGSLPPPQY